MKYYPAFLNLDGRKCLVIGQGPLVEEKAANLEEVGAQVRRRLSFDPSDAQDVLLIVADVSSEEASRISEFTDKHNVLVNIVDKPDFCTFILPSIVRRGDLTVAISTAGKSPSLAAKIRREFEAALDEEYGQLLDVLGETRALVKETLPQYNDRKCFYDGLLRLPLLETIREGGPEGVKRILNRQLQEYQHALA